MNDVATRAKKRSTNGKTYVQYYKKGDVDERNRFIEQHLPLVISIATKRMNQDIDIEELVQEGILGLITAAEKFDPQRGFQFSTYATWWIRQAINSYVIRRGDIISKPSNFTSYIKRLLKTTDSLETKLGRKPDIDEIAASSEMNKTMVRQLQALIPGTLSLNTPVSKDMDDQTPDHLECLKDKDSESPVDTCIKSQFREEMNRILENLSETERMIIDMRYGLSRRECMSLREIGKFFNLSAERIRQIEQQALSNLRQIESVKSMREYIN